MFTSKVPLVFERTIGDGNCSLNAFALGFIHPIFQQRFNNYLHYAHMDPNLRFAQFIRITAETLNLEPTWDSVIQTLLNIREHDKERLQRILAPSLRTLIIDMMEYDVVNIDRTFRNIATVFRSEICKQAGIKVFVALADDDTTSKVSEFKIQTTFYGKYIIQEINKSGFPIKEYNELNRKRNSKNASDKLTSEEIKTLKKLTEDLDKIFDPYIGLINDWWKHGKNSGYKLFLNYLRKDGVWLSDLELSYLASYFYIDLDVYRDNYFYPMFINNVSIPKRILSARQIDQLRIRGGIVDKEKETRDSLFFSQFNSADELTRRLSGLSLATIEFFSECKKHNTSINQTPVPDSITDSKDELHARNICERRVNKDGVAQEVFIVDEINKAYERSIEVEDYQAIVDWWQKHFYPVPKIRLSNPVSQPGYEHYENILPREEDLPWPFNSQSISTAFTLPWKKAVSTHSDKPNLKPLYMTAIVAYFAVLAVAMDNLTKQNRSLVSATDVKDQLESIKIAADTKSPGLLSTFSLFSKKSDKTEISGHLYRKNREMDML